MHLCFGFLNGERFLYKHFTQYFHRDIQSVWMSQLPELGKKLCLNKSTQKSLDSRNKQKSSSMQSFIEKVGFSGKRHTVCLSYINLLNLDVILSYFSDISVFLYHIKFGITLRQPFVFFNSKVGGEFQLNSSEMYCKTLLFIR